jgi:hypothetical protein
MHIYLKLTILYVFEDVVYSVWRRVISITPSPWSCESHKATENKLRDWKYNWRTLSLGGMETETCSPGWGLDARLRAMLRKKKML